MGLMVGTIFEWYNPNDADEDGEPVENCEDGQCVGIVTQMTKDAISGKPVVMVKFWEKCDKHTQIDPDGTGPYNPDYIWQVGQV